ncbi:PadR family transcriptional regulator [Dictyobacter kobayashii]|uniref:PadR family transcriptional regulator n=1 Tax=Dictyobacter kobayashii TaxID=2014872 RepID=A0A402AJV6_9CHLR|nr:helix-turn-helix transcriptional regulator [Dictyobacter kobayashii]GCE19363.1 PadR family transcriptional regulator [Dictyobacter kobayashii]
MPREENLGRYSEPALLILSSLMDGPKHGYAMMEDILQFSGTKLEPGTLYGAITRLEHNGWIEPLAAQERRRPYRITAAGVTALRERLTVMQRIVSISAQRLLANGS